MPDISPSYYSLRYYRWKWNLNHRGGIPREMFVGSKVNVMLAPTNGCYDKAAEFMEEGH